MDTRWYDESMLELVEEVAEERGMITSEEELSILFDADVAPAIIAKYGADEQPAINEGFNDWTDALCKDGQIHPEQYNNYCYVGKWSE